MNERFHIYGSQCSETVIFGLKRRLMRIISLGDTNSILNKFVVEFRDVDIRKDSLRFRRNVERIGEIMAYEISREFYCSTKDVQSPLGIAPMNTPDDRIVISTILYARLPFHQGLPRYLDNTGNALVSAYRKYKNHPNFDTHIEHIASPCLKDRTLIVPDPTLAIGSSMKLTCGVLLTGGVSDHIYVASIISSKRALEYLQEKMPNDKTTIWTVALDSDLGDYSYIVPGLGGAGGLAFGERE